MEHSEISIFMEHSEIEPSEKSIFMEHSEISIFMEHFEKCRCRGLRRGGLKGLCVCYVEPQHERLPASQRYG
jgi:hypothetical protein